MSIKNPLHGVMVVDHSFEHGRYNGFNEGVKAAVQYLEAPCPCADKHGVASRRIVDCPDCMKQVHEELGI